MQEEQEQTARDVLGALKKRIEWAYDKAEKELLKGGALSQVEEETRTSLKDIINAFNEDNQLRYEKQAGGWRKVFKPGFCGLNTAREELVPWEKVMFHLEEELGRGAPRPQEYFSAGEQVGALHTLSEIFRMAQSDIMIQDNFLSPNIVALIEPFVAAMPSISVRLLTRAADNSKLNALKVFLQAFRSRYPNCSIVARANDGCHDRFVIIDKTTVYHSGHSLHDLGKTACRLSTMGEPESRERVMADFETWWNNGTEIDSSRIV